MGSLVDGVDHVYVPMPDAAGAFAVLAEQLELPVLWPFTSFGVFASGGVSVGSIKLEIIEPNSTAPWSTAHEPPQIQGICTSRTLISEAAGAFVCDYYLPESRDLDRRRRVLVESGGGRLRVLDAVELVISTRDTRAAQSRWQRLLDPLQPAEPHTWRPAVGPAITLVEGDDERVDHLALAVRSAETADEVWAEAAQSRLGRFPLRFVAG